MTSAESAPASEGAPASASPAPDQGVSLVGVPLPAEVLQSDPGILTDSVRGSGAPSEAGLFRADLEQRR